MTAAIGEQPDRTDEQAQAEALRWFVPPRLRTADRLEERRASWLELFFDLVFVVAITQLSHELVVDHSAAGFLTFAGLFVPVFVAWQGFSFYADRFDTDDLAFRAVFGAGMLAIIALAGLIDDVAHGERTVGFALSYIALRSLMLSLYARAWFAVPDARPLIRLYGGGYAIGVAIWIASLAVPTPGRYWVWGFAQVLELSLPPLSTRIHRRVPTSASHVPERWALFTLIVLGESVVAVAAATSSNEWHVSSATVAILGFAAVAGIWWLYYDRQALVVLTGSTRSVVVYSYAHLPLLMGLAALSAGIHLAIEESGHDHLAAGAAVAVCGGVALFLGSLIVTRVLTVTGPVRLGLTLKLSTLIVVLLLLLLQPVASPALLVGLVALALVVLVYLQRTYVDPKNPT
jgi:low temperature requirement protein LtrA